MQQIVSNGTIVKMICPSGRRLTYFPGKRDNRVCHVPPHALNKEDTYKLPVRDKLTELTHYTKQSFWLNDTYI